MGLSGLEIYKLLPRTNCRDCGFATCLAFAMALAQKKASLDKCPHVTSDAREALESASQPPIKLVTIGNGARKIEVGNETVMYRHEQKFYHPAAVGFLIEDSMEDADIAKAASSINSLSFERVGQRIAPDIICIRNVSGYRNKFISALKRVMNNTELNIALSCGDFGTMDEAVKISKERKPLIICEDKHLPEQFINIAKENDCPLAITCSSAEEAADMTDRAKKKGFDQIVINLDIVGIARRIQDYTFIRRSALKKSLRALGYPVMSFTSSNDSDAELAEAITYILKYSSIVIMRNFSKDFVLPMLVVRQDIYQDPQKPVQVEPKIYEIGKPDKNSPVLITTNFSITYFTVAGEVEASKVSAYILCCDAEGMSVLTAWAAEKFTAESMYAAIQKSGIQKMVSHRKVIIPGYVSVLSGKLEEISGYKVVVGPREASGISNFLRSWK